MGAHKPVRVNPKNRNYLLTGEIRADHTETGLRI
jgi:hypothetical protein